MNGNPQVQEVASMIDHSVLQPTTTDADVVEASKVALRWNVASMCVKPYAVAMTSELLRGSAVRTCTVIGFPHGAHHARIKLEESRQALADGATELDMVVNIGKVLQGDWTYVAAEIKTLQDLCFGGNAILKVIFENDYLPTPGLKIRLTNICRDLGVAFVKTSTGYGYVKQANGLFLARGATLDDCKLMVDNAGPRMKVKAAGGIRTLSDLLAFKAIGVSRIGATATDSILSELAGSTSSSR